MNELSQVFMYQGAQVRTVIKNGEPWFVAKDVCEILEHSDTSTAVRRLDDDEKLTQTMFVSGQNREVWLVNEPGLYSLILTSRKPEAKEFKRWITHEVIPSIRKHGAYMTPETIEKTLLNPDFIIGLAKQLKEEQTKRIQAEQQIEKQKPLVTFAQTCMTSDRSLLVREVAKLASKNGIMIGERRLYSKLREWGMIMQYRNEPTQRAMEMGLFEIKKGVYSTPEGSRDYETPKVTVKGQMYIIERLKREKANETA